MAPPRGERVSGSGGNEEDERQHSSSVLRRFKSLNKENGVTSEQPEKRLFFRGWKLGTCRFMFVVSSGMGCDLFDSARDVLFLERKKSCAPGSNKTRPNHLPSSRLKMQIAAVHPRLNALPNEKVEVSGTVIASAQRLAGAGRALARRDEANKHWAW